MHLSLKSSLFTFLTGLSAVLAPSAGWATTFHVAPKGSDSNPGTLEQPVATLEAARDAARKSGKGPHVITVTPGEYFMAKPLELDAQDNGLTLEASTTNGSAVLYGGKPVTGWQRDGDKLWTADLPGVKEGAWDFRALVVNGRLAERAVYPGTNTFDNLGTWSLPLLPAVAGHWERKPTREESTTMPYKPEDIPATLDIRNA